jgi:cytochrome c551
MARLIACLAVGLALLAGCGGGKPEPGGGAADGPEARQFAETCGQCHTFGPAGTNGAVGPPLDGTQLDTAAIEGQIDRGGDGMPPGLVSGAERAALARWIVENAGR